MDAHESRRRQIERLRAPIEWRPALQVGDSSRFLPKAALRRLVETAQGTQPR